MSRTFFFFFFAIHLGEGSHILSQFWSQLHRPSILRANPHPASIRFRAINTIRGTGHSYHPTQNRDISYRERKIGLPTVDYSLAMILIAFSYTPYPTPTTLTDQDWVRRLPHVRAYVYIILHHWDNGMKMRTECVLVVIGLGLLGLVLTP